MRRICISVFAIALSGATICAGQTVPDSVYSVQDSPLVMPEVTIVATRFSLPQDRTPARVERVDRAEIEAFAARTLGEILNRSGSGFIRSHGPGGLAGVSLRGSGPGHTALLLDGHRLSNPQLGQIDLSLLPALLITSVDVLHGGGASRFGSDAMAGAIDLSMASADATGIEVSTLAGAWGERSYGTRAMLRGDRMDVTVAGEFSEAQGDFGFVDESRFPRRRTERANADRRSLNLYAKVRRRTDGTSSQLAAWVLTSERGLPGLAGTASTDERQWDDMVHVWGAHSWSGSRHLTQLQASYQTSSIRYTDPSAELDQEGVTRSVFVSAAHTRHFETVRLRSGMDLSTQHADHPALGAGVGQIGAAMYVTGAVAALDNVELYPAVRADWLVRDADVTTSINPSLRALLATEGQQRIALKGGIERTFRFPTFNDLYWRGAGAHGNPDLLPETGLSADVGVSVSSGRLFAEVTGFVQRIRNRISWLPGPDGTWAPDNIGRTRSIGLEVSAQGVVRAGPGSLVLRSGYELVDARDRSRDTPASNNSQLRYVPLHSGHLSASVEVAPVSVGASVRAVGRRYVTTDGSSWLDPYCVVDARLGLNFQLGRSRFAVAAMVENVTGVEYEPIAGYPMPPRHVRVHVKFSI